MYIKILSALVGVFFLLLLVCPRTFGSGERQYDEIINRAARENGLDPALVKAVIKAESDFRESCVSKKGACGLMQLMPSTARLLAPSFLSSSDGDLGKNIMHPEKNIRMGARYLRDMIYLFEGDIVKALAAYNAGPSVVKKYNGVPPYKETQNYIRKVITNKKRYSSCSRVYYYTAPDGSVVFFNR